MVMWLSQGGKATDRLCQLKAHEDTAGTRAVLKGHCPPDGALLEGVLSSRGCCVGLFQPPSTTAQPNSAQFPTASSVTQALSPKQFLLQVSW